MLPSSKRPKEVVEEREARVAQLLEEQRKKDKVVVRITKVDIFKRSMVEWYEGLNPKQQKRVRPIDLKRKAVNICFREQIVYDDLPANWVTELREKTGLKFCQKKKKVEEKVLKSSETSTERFNPRERREVKTTQSLQLDPRSRSYSGKAPNSSSAGNPTGVTGKGGVNYETGTKKKWVDLSNDPPPPAWLKAYAEGTELPRTLTVHSTENQNIIFYDYNPRFKDADGNEFKPAPRPRLNCKLFEEGIGIVGKAKPGKKKRK